VYNSINLRLKLLWVATEVKSKVMKYYLLVTQLLTIGGLSIVDSPSQLWTPSAIPAAKHGQLLVQQMSVPDTERIQVIKLSFLQCMLESKKASVTALQL